ncbi:MAG: hypothetical protein NTZ21_03115, partial [Actinobacteria bacterium]|nr:hypothetical protein [Actinomycetota bacterium]
MSVSTPFTSSTTSASVGGNSRTGATGLTRPVLLRFGAIIAVAIIALVGVGIRAETQSDMYLEKVKGLAATRGLLRTVYADAETLRASLLGIAAEGVTAEEADGFHVELQAATDAMLANFATAVDTVPRPGPLATKVDEIQPRVQPTVDAAIAAHAAIDAAPDGTVVIDTPEYEAFAAEYSGFRAELDDAIALANLRVDQVQDQATSAGDRSLMITLLTGVLALAAFGYVGRKVYRSVARMNALQAEMARVTSMVENSPTNMMFCGPDMTIQYMNPVSLKTLRTIEHLLPCKVDGIIGQSVDIFHKNPAYQRGILSNPAAKLPHRANIVIGNETMDLNVTAITGEDGTHLGAMATWSLITEQLRIEREAAELQERERAAAADLQTKVNSLNTTLAAAAAGDLTAQVTVVGDDAIGQMGTAVAKLLGDLRGSIQAIAVNSEALAAAAEELQVVSAQMGGNSAETSR